MTLEELSTMIKQRKEKRPVGSYVASLFDEGIDRIAQKVGEEAVEVVIASKNDNADRFKEEAADLVFMLSILLVEKNITWEDIITILEKRKK